MARKVLVANPLSGKKIEDISLNIIRRFQPHVLSKPQSFDIGTFFDLDLESVSGLTTGVTALNTNIHGYTDIEKMECMIASQIAEDSRQSTFLRSTQAHETGHAILHVKQFRARKAVLRFIHDNQHTELRLFSEEHIPLYCNPEWQAWRFAGAILMPAQIVYELIKKGYSAYELAKVFDVSIPFVNSRLKALKMSTIR